MANVFSDYTDVSTTRAAADRLSDLADGEDSSDARRLLYQLDAVRLEIRAAAQTISSAIGAAIEEWRGEMRGQR